MTRRTLFGSVVIFSCASSLESQGAPSKTLQPTPKTLAWGYCDAKTPPVLRLSHQ